MKRTEPPTEVGGQPATRVAGKKDAQRKLWLAAALVGLLGLLVATERYPDNPYSASHWLAVDVSVADQTFTLIPRGLWVGSGGHVTVLSEDGTSGTFNNVPSGTWLAVRPLTVKNVGTTASNMVAVW